MGESQRHLGDSGKSVAVGIAQLVGVKPGNVCLSQFMRSFERQAERFGLSICRDKLQIFVCRKVTQFHPSFILRFKSTSSRHR